MNFEKNRFYYKSITISLVEISAVFLVKIYSYYSSIALFHHDVFFTRDFRGFFIFSALVLINNFVLDKTLKSRLLISLSILAIALHLPYLLSWYPGFLVIIIGWVLSFWIGKFTLFPLLEKISDKKYIISLIVLFLLIPPILYVVYLNEKDLQNSLELEPSGTNIDKLHANLGNLSDANTLPTEIPALIDIANNEDIVHCNQFFSKQKEDYCKNSVSYNRFSTPLDMQEILLQFYVRRGGKDEKIVDYVCNIYKSLAESGNNNIFPNRYDGCYLMHSITPNQCDKIKEDPESGITKKECLLRIDFRNNYNTDSCKTIVSDDHRNMCLVENSLNYSG